METKHQYRVVLDIIYNNDPNTTLSEEAYNGTSDKKALSIFCSTTSTHLREEESARIFVTLLRNGVNVKKPCIFVY